LEWEFNNKPHLTADQRELGALDAAVLG